MFKILLFCFFFSLSSWGKERVTGRSPAIFLSKDEVLRELNIFDEKKAKNFVRENLKVLPIDSALRNRFLMYRDTLKVKLTAPKRAAIYHADSWEKKWHRFKNRIHRGFTLSTIVELGGLFLLIAFLFEQRKREEGTKESLPHFHNRTLRRFLAEVTFQLDEDQHMEVDFHQNESRSFILLSFNKELTNREKKGILKNSKEILGKKGQLRVIQQKNTFIISCARDGRRPQSTI